MRATELPRRVVYLELFDSLLDRDGGEGRTRFNLVRDFPWAFEEGWEIERWGLRRGKPRPFRGDLSRVKGLTFRLPAFPRVLLPVVVWATQFVQAVLRPRAGILVAYSPIMGTGAAAARLLRRRSSVLVIRIISDFWSSRAGALYGRRGEARILRALERFVLRRADLVLPMGSFTHQIATQAGVPEERIVELPRPTRWAGMELIPAEEECQPRVACAGRLVPDKGFDLLVAAFAEIAQEFPDVLLDVAGEGPQRSNLQKLVASLGIADRVRFRGWLNANAMPGFFEGALVAVLPSRASEGLPMALVDAGVAGCALIGSDVGGIRDIVHPGRTGILVPPNDPAALADALRTLLQDPEKAQRLGAGARAEARAYIGRRDEALLRVRERLRALRAGNK
jgi:glycosyltransferase involved in cell wall biosynthesis